jgi:anti-anti-sigma factor
MSGMELRRSSADPGNPAAGCTRGVRTVHGLRCRLTIRLAETTDRTRATVTGEVDLDSAAMLQHVLTDSLRLPPGGLDLDLRGIEFFDCSGLSVLLRLRALAEQSGTEFTVPAMAPVVTRVLELTGTHGLFALPRSRES